MSGFQMTPRQLEVWNAFGFDKAHTLLYGGSRSGKTFLIMYAIVCRALAHSSRHAALRFRFGHIKASVVHDTLPAVMRCFPGLAEVCTLNKTDWVYTLPARDGGHSRGRY